MNVNIAGAQGHRPREKQIRQPHRRVGMPQVHRVHFALKQAGARGRRGRGRGRRGAGGGGIHFFSSRSFS
jgi:hypothetical protein